MGDNKKIISISRIGFTFFVFLLLIAIFISGCTVNAKQPTSKKLTDEHVLKGRSNSLYRYNIGNPLTGMERDYIANSTVIKAAGVDGIAPLSYIDDNGEVQGIFYRVLNRISEMTGLVFECRLYQSVEEALNSDADLVYSISASYAPEHMIVSQPFLRTETILYMNYSVDPNQLDDKIYA